jgi:hypothetical protein
MAYPPLIAVFAWPQVVCGVIWSGLVILTVALPLVLRSRWGSAEPLRRCIVLSVWAHVLLAAMATTVPVVRSLGPPGPGGDGTMRVTMLSDAEMALLEGTDEVPAENLVEPVADAPPPEVEPVEAPPVEASVVETVEITEPPADVPPSGTSPATVAAAPSEVSPAPPTTFSEPIAESIFVPVQTPEEAAAIFGDDKLVEVAPPQVQQSPSNSATNSTGQSALPEEYQWRRSGDKQAIVSAGGGSADTEAAVQASLAWLAKVQARDGRWDADQHGAGHGPGQDATRVGAGIEADTGVTGLALLAFLASGHTHEEGPYRDVVRRGLRFLMSSQAENGNLSGKADVFASMYCHGMAGVALAEAYGMTADEELRRPVERAVMFTLAAQHPNTGGWRYRPGDLGDTSQLGWQLMLLRSARIAGLRVANDPFVGAGVFLKHVSSGVHGGLASYRFNEPVSSPMTAEALACRQFLGMVGETPVAIEAAERLMNDLPGKSADNYYYWYYGTLAMHQLGGHSWETWNRALQTRLLGSQTASGPYAGSWNPDAVWGGHGGRIYSTALATLSLEVYYRYLPMVDETAAKSRRVK